MPVTPTTILVASVACALAGCGVLLWKAKRPWPRALLFASLAAVLFGLAAFVRLIGAEGVAESITACRMFYLAGALGALPIAALATMPEITKRSFLASGRGAFLGGVAIVGLAFASLAGSDLVVSDVVRDGDRLEVGLGVAGRFLLVYLTAVSAYILTQLESLVRAMSPFPVRAARMVVLMLGASVLVFAYVSAETLVYGRWNVPATAWASVPLAATCVVAGLAGLRKSFDDMKLPLGRGVVYSSFTLFVLGGMWILLGVGARLAEVLGFSVDQQLLTLGVVAGALLGVSLWVSPSWKRRVAVFIDENFYVNRHDYRKEWERVARTVRPTGNRVELVRAVAETVRSIFDAEVYVGVASVGLGRFAVYDRTGSVLESFVPPLNGDLARLVAVRDTALVLSDNASDLDLVRPYVENQDAIDRLGIAVVVPMSSGGQLVGLLFIAEPASGSPFTPEDLGLMTVIGSALANPLYGHLLLREVEERREGEALVKFSAFVLHELRNSVSGLRGLAEGATKHMNNPEFRADLVAALTATSERMGALLDRLGYVRSAEESREGARVPVGVATFIGDALDQSGARRAAGVRVELRLEEGITIAGDRSQLAQVLVNLFRNAIDAMPSGGVLSIVALRTEDGSSAEISVRDTGCGMSADFMARSLFRPFSTTKTNGLGVGLYQCKNVIEEHGGQIAVESEIAKGTTVTMRLPIEKGVPERCATVC